MYYEPYEKKKKSKKRRGGCLGALMRKLVKLLAVLLALALVAGGVLYLLPTGLFLVEPEADLALTDGLPSSPFNVLVLGVDVLSSGVQRSDTIIVASIDRSSVRLTSIQRDLLANIQGHGTQKINAAFAHGGPELAMRTINETFGLNIVGYVVADFTALVRMVDALGGIEVDVAEAEVSHVNRNVLGSAGVFAPLGYHARELTEFGPKTHLDGLQALGYARIRKLDSDFNRTSRQRTVIMAMLSKLRRSLYNPVVVARFLKAALGGVQTNLSPVELVSLGEKALLSGSIEQLRLPLDGTFSDDGSSLRFTNRDANIRALRTFLYGEAAE